MDLNLGSPVFQSLAGQTDHDGTAVDSHVVTVFGKVVTRQEFCKGFGSATELKNGLGRVKGALGDQSYCRHILVKRLSVPPYIKAIVKFNGFFSGERRRICSFEFVESGSAGKLHSNDRGPLLSEIVLDLSVKTGEVSGNHRGIEGGED